MIELLNLKCHPCLKLIKHSFNLEKWNERVLTERQMSVFMTWLRLLSKSQAWTISWFGQEQHKPNYITMEPRSKTYLTTFFFFNRKISIYSCLKNIGSECITWRKLHATFLSNIYVLIYFLRFYKTYNYVICWYDLKSDFIYSFTDPKEDRWDRPNLRPVVP